jgi:hypothetical protein
MDDIKAEHTIICINDYSNKVFKIPMGKDFLIDGPPDVFSLYSGSYAGIYHRGSFKEGVGHVYFEETFVS